MPTRIKRYEAELNELDALLARIEQEMGPSAQLETREFSRGGVLGVGGVRMVEIIATLELEDSVFKGSKTQSASREPVASEKHNGNGAREEVIKASRLGQDERARESAARSAEESEALPATPRQATLKAYNAARKADPGKVEEDAPGPPPARSPQRAAAPAEREKSRPSEADLLRHDLRQMQKSMDELRSSLSQLVESQQKTQNLAAEAARTAAEARSASGPAKNTAPETAAVAGLPAVQQQVINRLLDWNIAQSDARQLLESTMAHAERSGQRGVLQDEAALLAAVSREICRSILLADGIQPPQREEGRNAYLVALVGPTGVGKTTTIAKLAAQFAFQQGRRVGLASLDNYRIAAAEQLRTYAEIIGLPLEIVFSAEEFARVVEAQRSAELLLVDTAGRSPLNEKQILDLAAVFEELPPDEVHLVISATTKYDDLAGILEGFAPLKFNRIIISKLDETRSLGCLYNINKLAQVPISYFAVGQSVPEDLRPAQLSFIQSWIEQGRIT